MAFLDFEGEQVLILEQQPAPIQLTNTSRTGQVMRQFPYGEYFSRVAGWLPATSRAIARFLSRLWNRKLALEKNMDPRTSDELLDEWEQLYELEPDPALTIDERRAAVLTKVRSLGGVTSAYYQALAVDFGHVDAVVTDAADPFTTVSLADDFLGGGEWKLTFTVTATSRGAVLNEQLQLLIDSQLLAGWFAFYDFI